jgi:hypothetical protein
MSNGVALAHLPLAASASTFAPTDKPDAAPAQTEIETAIGETAASAVIALSQAMVEYREHGAISRATKAAGTEHVARLVELRLGMHDKIEFATVTRRQGRDVLRARRVRRSTSCSPKLLPPWEP